MFAGEIISDFQSNSENQENPFAFENRDIDAHPREETEINLLIQLN